MLEALPEMSTDYATALLKDFDEELSKLQGQVDALPQAPRRRGRPKSSPGVKTSRIQHELACLGPSPELFVGSRSRAPLGKSLRCAVYLFDPGVLLVPYEAVAATSAREFHGNQHEAKPAAQLPLPIYEERLRDPNRAHGVTSRAARADRKSRKVLVYH